MRHEFAQYDSCGLGDRFPSCIGVFFLSVALLFACGSLRGQELPPIAPDPFDNFGEAINRTADEQLTLLNQTRDRPGADPQHINDNVVPAHFSEWRRVSMDGSTNPVNTAELRLGALGVNARKIFAQEEVPLELLAVAQVESGFNSRALSPKGALGLWQFMPGTARRYGLRVDLLADERLDAGKETHAAARYLRDLHLRFGDWLLALAAYDAGEETIQHAIDRGGSNDFWRLSRSRLLPQETRAYVPAILSALDSLGAHQNDIGPGPRPVTRVFSNGIMYATTGSGIHAQQNVGVTIPGRKEDVR